MAYTIGQTIFWKGRKVTIIGDPFDLYGGEFQEVIDEDGVKHSVVSPEYAAAELERKQKLRKEEQAAFRKLKRIRK